MGRDEGQIAMPVAGLLARQAEVQAAEYDR